MKPTGRRGFLKTVAAAGTLPQVRVAGAQPSAHAPIEYPRKYSGRHLAMLAFPLGGVGAGCISLGGRGQLRDWEIFNKPDKGRSPAYDFPSIWCGKVTRVLEASILAPYEGSSGLGAANVPGLPRLARGDGKLTYLRGWRGGTRWRVGPQMFWDDFSADGELGPEAPVKDTVASLCLTRDIPARKDAEFTFLLSWHFPNRTPQGCGWT